MIRQAIAIALVSGMIGLCGIAMAEEPTVIYETFIPGYYIPDAKDIVVDDAGNAYFLGFAYADEEHPDIIVVKLDPLGNELWTYYFEGSGSDYAKGLALDSGGDLWVTGNTGSPDFPLVDPLDDTLTGFVDIFLMELDADTGGILYSTFIGGDYVDEGRGIAIGEGDEIYLTGFSGSTDFPTTPDAYQPEPSAPLYLFQDAVILKLSPSGDEILYSTYFGGFRDEWGDRIGLDGLGNIIIAGYTTSDDLPLANAYDSEPNNIFVSKFSPDGGTLLFSTYLGGSDYDRMAGMFVDGSGNAYLAGLTRSVDFPTTPGAFQEEFVGGILACEVPFGIDYNCEDWFACSLSTSGSGMNWCTYLGGSTVDEAKSIVADDLGNVYVAGFTSSNDFPLYDGGFGSAFAVCKLTDNGSTLAYTHSIDSSSANRSNGITLDGARDIYFTGTVGVPASLYASKLEGDHPVVGVDDGSVPVTTSLVLDRNFPNPFNPATSIRYVIPAGNEALNVDLSIYDAGGRFIRNLVDEQQAPGSHRADWQGRDEQGAQVGAGVYFYRLSCGGQSITRSMVLLK